MVQIPSWEANWFADSQEFPRISRKPKVHYRTQMNIINIIYIISRLLDLRVFTWMDTSLNDICTGNTRIPFTDCYTWVGNRMLAYVKV